MGWRSRNIIQINSAVITHKRTISQVIYGKLIDFHCWVDLKWNESCKFSITLCVLPKYKIYSNSVMTTRVVAKSINWWWCPVPPTRSIGLAKEFWIVDDLLLFVWLFKSINYISKFAQYFCNGLLQIHILIKILKY